VSHRKIVIWLLVAVVICLLAYRGGQISTRDEPQVVPTVQTMSNQLDPATRRLLVRYQVAAAGCDEGGSR
jgi:hypothetical protein